MDAIFEPVGTFGNYSVFSMLEVKKLFPKSERVNPETGEKEEKSVMIRRFKRTLRVQHSCGTSVDFTAYVHGGKMRYRDSRDKTSKNTPVHVVAELRRMLKVSESEAGRMLNLQAA